MGSKALTPATDRGRSSSDECRMMCSAHFVNGAGVTLLRRRAFGIASNGAMPLALARAVLTDIAAVD
jgi:hypothetical protein